MSLFTMEKKQAEEKAFSAVERFTGSTQTILAKSSLSIKEAIGSLAKDSSTVYVSGGRWSAHELRAYVLQQTGPAKVYMSTWAMSEDSSRLLHAAIEAGLITELNCIFDRRLPVRKPGIMQLAKQLCTRISLVDCHAKVTVIQNDDWNITIIGSANDTNNKRIEAGVIICNKTVADFNIIWMNEQLLGGDPFNWKK